MGGLPPDDAAAPGTGGGACEPPEPPPPELLLEPGTAGGACEPPDEPPPKSVAPLEPGTGGGACEPLDEPPAPLEPGTPGGACDACATMRGERALGAAAAPNASYARWAFAAAENNSIVSAADAHEKCPALLTTPFSRDGNQQPPSSISPYH